MRYPGPTFGARNPQATYVDRPGAYAVIRGDGDLLAFIPGSAGRLHLPGGGIAPGESAESALLREIEEEIGWHAQILDVVGHATQFLFAGDEGHFAIRATYVRARLITRSSGACEHDVVWLSRAAAMPLLARESDAWAIAQSA